MHSFREFLTELSNETLASYKRKANAHLRNRRRVYPARLAQHYAHKPKYYGIEFLHNPKLGDKREQGIKTAEKKLKKRYAHMNEDAAVNAAGSGAVEGMGVGPKGEPGIQKKARTKLLSRLLPKKLLKTVTTESVEPGPGQLLVEPPVVRSKFAGSDVFQVPSEYFHKARLGKAKYAHYKHYVGKDEIGSTIRQFGNRHYGKPIIVQDQATQHMLYLRYGKGR